MFINTGISTELCIVFPAISATAEGYDAYAAIDASGTFWQAKREAGLLRMQQAGVIPMDHATPMIEVLPDNPDPLAPDGYRAPHMPVAGIVGPIASAIHEELPNAR